jgi:hypothetical protein
VRPANLKVYRKCEQTSFTAPPTVRALATYIRSPLVAYRAAWSTFKAEDTASPLNPPRMKKVSATKIRRLAGQGFSAVQIGEQLGCSRMTVTCDCRKRENRLLHYPGG